MLALGQTSFLLLSQRVLKLLFPSGVSQPLTLANMCRSVVDSSHKGLVCSYFIPEGSLAGAGYTPPLAVSSPALPSACDKATFSSRAKVDKKNKKERKVDVG